MSALQELIERVEKASGADREIDEAVAMTLLGLKRCKLPLPAGGLCNEVHEAPPLTSSLDAVVALIEREMPGHYWIIGQGRLTRTGALFGAQIIDPENDEVLGEGETDASPTLAILLAFLKARSANPPPQVRT